MNAVEMIERSQLVDRPEMRSGDTVRVHVKVREGDKERIQVYEGMVIGMHRGGSRASVTVRKVARPTSQPAMLPTAGGLDGPQAPSPASAIASAATPRRIAAATW